MEKQTKHKEYDISKSETWKIHFHGLYRVGTSKINIFNNNSTYYTNAIFFINSHVITAYETNIISSSVLGDISPGTSLFNSFKWPKEKLPKVYLP